MNDVDYDNNGLEKAIREMPIKTERAQMRVAAKIAADARRMAPRLKRTIIYPSFQREPGWLAQTIDADHVMGGGTVVQVGAFYGLFVEYGTEHMHAEPFLRPAAILNEPELIDEVSDALRSLE